jgi:hypothetical protein
MNCRSRGGWARETATRIEALGHRAECHQLSIGDPERVTAVIDAAQGIISTLQ